MIGRDNLDLGSTQVGQATGPRQRQRSQLGMRLVDDLRRELDRGKCRFASSCRITGERENHANLDVIHCAGLRAEHEPDKSRQAHQLLEIGHVLSPGFLHKIIFQIL